MTFKMVGVAGPSDRVNADNEVAHDLGVQRALVACFVQPEDMLDPCHDLMREGVGRLVQIDDAQPGILGDGPLDGP